MVLVMADAPQLPVQAGHSARVLGQDVVMGFVVRGVGWLHGWTLVDGYPFISKRYSKPVGADRNAFAGPFALPFPVFRALVLWCCSRFVAMIGIVG